MMIGLLAKAHFVRGDIGFAFLCINLRAAFPVRDFPLIALIIRVKKAHELMPPFPSPKSSKLKKINPFIFKNGRANNSKKKAS